MNIIDNFNKTYQLKERIPHTLLVALVFSLFYTFFFSPVIFSGGVLAPGDGVVFYLPGFYGVRTLWTDLIWSGFPVAADPQIQTWYPPSLLFSLIPNSWNAFVISAYVLASCFTYGYVYSLTHSRLAALVSGIVYGMTGFMMAHLGHTAIIHAAAWMPLLIWATARLCAHLSPLWLVTGTFALACSILAGHPQISFYGLGLSTVYALVLGGTASVGRWKYYRTYLAVIVLGVSLTAIQIVPTAELSGLGLRSRMTFDQFVSYSLPLEQITQLLFPYLFGGGGPFKPYFDPPYFGDWNLTEISGYMGLLPLLLAGVGFIVNRDRPIARFWLSAGLIALLLALGNGTPLARLMYNMPVYNKFRAPVRHLIEVALAMSVLAGLGVAAIQRQTVSKRSILKIVLVSVGLFAIALATIFIFSPQLQKKAIAAGAKSLSFFPWNNPAVGVPLVIFLLVIAVLLYFITAKPSRFSLLLLVLLVAIDLGSFGWFYEWRYGSPSQDSLIQTATAQKYKELLIDSQQRMLPIQGVFGGGDAVAPNLSRLWGVPSASGYGPLILSRVSQLLSMNPVGEVQGNWIARDNRSLDIMSIRYVFLPKSPVITDNRGVSWSRDNLILSLGSGCGFVVPNSIKFGLPERTNATAIGIVSSLGCSAEIPDNTEVLDISLIDAKGTIITQHLQAGRDTSEWAYDCTDVRPKMQHRKAPIFGSFPIVRDSFPTCEGHQYVSILPLNKLTDVKSVSLEWMGTSGSIAIQKISLIENTTNSSYPITELSNTARWHHVEDINQTTVYENLRAMPRAWLVPEVVSAKHEEVLQAIQSSRLPDGRTYEPSQMALVEEPLAFKAPNPDSLATAKIVNLADTYLKIQTQSASEAFLVLSDVYYPGWQATIDGKPAHIFQTNYVLRGVKVPAGKHQILFHFKPLSFHIGVGISTASLVVLGYLGFQLLRQQTYKITSS